MAFVEFFFDSSQVFGVVKSEKDWEVTVRKFYARYPENNVYACQQHADGTDNFGQYPEHSGSKTLGQFFDEHGMQKI
jgi:hypothetical protein